MSLTVAVPEDVAASARAIARSTGASAEGLLVQALRAHFPPIPRELQREFDALERAADEDLLELDRLLGVP